MVRSGNVFLPLSLSQSEDSWPRSRATGSSAFRSPRRADSNGAVPRGEVGDASRRRFAPRGRAGRAMSVFPADGDGIFRRLPMAAFYQGQPHPVGAAGLADPSRSGDVLDGIPLDGEGRTIIRYHGGAGTYTILFRRAPSSIPGRRWRRASAPGPAGRVRREDRPRRRQRARHPRPPAHAASSAVYPGVEIQATVLDNILAGDFIRAPPRVVLDRVSASSLAADGGRRVSRLRKVGHQVAVLRPVRLACPSPRPGLGFRGGRWLELVVPEIAVVSAFVAAALLNYGVEGKQRRFIKGVFRHYLSPDVIERIIENPASS